MFITREVTEREHDLAAWEAEAGGHPAHRAALAALYNVAEVTSRGGYYRRRRV